MYSLKFGPENVNPFIPNLSKQWRSRADARVHMGCIKYRTLYIKQNKEYKLIQIGFKCSVLSKGLCDRDLGFNCFLSLYVPIGLLR